MPHINFIEQSLFLCNHKSIKEFVKNLSFLNNSSQKQSLVVCERREDLSAIKTQFYIEMGNELNGIKFYSLDEVGKQIYKHLSSKKELIKLPLTGPYLDVYQQEKMIALLLKLFGYIGGDVNALAKQILILIDIQLPQHTNLLEIILETQNQARFTSNEQTLKQVLATIQHAHSEFEHYARLQSLVNDFFNSANIESIFAFDQIKQNNASQSEQHYLLPHPILNYPILWIGAPEYSENSAYINRQNDENVQSPIGIPTKTIKPGNVQNSIIDDLKNTILNIRNHYSKNIFYDVRTILSSSKEIQAEIDISKDDQSFLKTITELGSRPKLEAQINSPNKQDNVFILLGDFDPNYLQSIREDAGGAYSFTENEYELWLKKHHEKELPAKLECSPSKYLQSVYEQLDNNYKEHSEIASLIKKQETLQKISNIYNLNNRSFEDIFKAYVLNEKLLIEKPHPLQNAGKILSFYACKKQPNEIISIGKPHTSITSSLHVKIFNQVFFLLKNYGVDITIPSTESIYSSFWKHILNQFTEIKFLLNHKNAINSFPSYIKVKDQKIISHYETTSGTDTPGLNNFVENFSRINLKSTNKPIYDWITKLSWNSKAVSITQFEDYIFCPHKFFLKHILNIKKKEIQNTADLKIIGTKMHKICEQLITRLVTIFGNKEFTTSVLPLLENIVLVLKNEDLFLSFEKNDWIKKIKSIIYKEENNNLHHDLIIAFCESIDEIWHETSETNYPSLEQREILKRTFLKFLITETEHLKAQKKEKVGILREYPLHFEFSGIYLVGRIDRLDLTKDGLDIIDYKTSNIAKSPREIVLYPSLAQKNSQLKLSVQGALYSYGFLKSSNKSLNTKVKTENDCEFSSFSQKQDNDDNAYYQIKHYSLYFLKNLEENKNNYFSFNFDEPLSIHSDSYYAIEKEYKPYIDNLLQGVFIPNPLQKENTCMFCEFKPLCPNSYR